MKLVIIPAYKGMNYTPEQGHYVERPGKIFVEVRGDRESIDQVKVSGTAVTVMKGTLHF